jgi:hypothetical protein
MGKTFFVCVLRRRCCIISKFVLILLRRSSFARARQTDVLTSRGVRGPWAQRMSLSISDAHLTETAHALLSAFS